MKKIILSIILAAQLNYSHAFESWEHKQLSDLAYHIASSVYYCGNLESCPERADVEFSDPVTKYKKDNITYGDIVKCVDYYLTPEKLISSRDNNLATEANYKDNFNSLIPLNEKSLDLDVKNRCQDSFILNGNQQSSSHANHTHFQAELFLSRKIYHSLALIESNEEYSDFKNDERSVVIENSRLKNEEMARNPIFGALVINAISDHYLQDIFAPGHIVTWRSKLTDVAANAYHDKINRRGLTIDVNRHWLNTKLRFLQTNSGKPFPFLEKIEKALQKNNRIATYFYSNYCKENKTVGACNPPIQEHIEDFSARSKRILKNLAITPSYTKERSSLSTDSIKITVRGDDFLWDERQDTQRMIMLLTQIRSIIDVFYSANHPPIDSFSGKTNSWNWEINNTTISDSTITARFGPISYEIPVVLDSSNFDSEKQSENENTITTGNINYIDPIIGISIGKESMDFGYKTNRNSIAIEMVIDGDTSLKRDAWNSFFAMSINSFNESGSWRPGFGFRYGWALPNTETLFSIPIRILQHESPNGGSSWKPSIGLRVDQGFSSFISLYLQATHDYASQPDRTLKAGLSFGAGVEISAPICRAIPTPFIKYVGNCR